MRASKIDEFAPYPSAASAAAWTAKSTKRDASASVSAACPTDTALVLQSAWPSLTPSLAGASPAAASASSPGKPLPVVPRLAAADRDRSNVRREAEVRSTDGAPARDHGRHAALDHGEQQVEERQRDPRTAAREPDAANDQRGAADRLWKRLPHADRPAANQLLLKVLELRTSDAELDIGSETGVEAVDGFVPFGVALDHGARLGHDGPRGFGQGQHCRAGGERDPDRRS